MFLSCGIVHWNSIAFPSFDYVYYYMFVFFSTIASILWAPVTDRKSIKANSFWVLLKLLLKWKDFLNENNSKEKKNFFIYTRKSIIASQQNKRNLITSDEEIH